MDIRTPEPKSAAALLRAGLTEMGLSIKHAQALELVARMHGYNSWRDLERDPAATADLALKIKAPDTYSMSAEPGTGCFIEVGGLKARLFADGSGVSLAIFAKDYAASLLPVEGERVLASARASHASIASPVSRMPNPTKPFHGCELPFDIRSVEFVSSDARALDWSDTRRVVMMNNSVVEWWNAGANTNDADLSEDLLEYFDADAGTSVGISMQALHDATLRRDGRFELADGSEFYLITHDATRWEPREPRSEV